MDAYVTPCVPTRTGYLRLRFPELRDWSGEIHVTGLADDPLASLLVTVRSDAGFAPLDVRIEESADRVCWSECVAPRPQIEIARRQRAASPPRTSPRRSGSESPPSK